MPVPELHDRRSGYRMHGGRGHRPRVAAPARGGARDGDRGRGPCLDGPQAGRPLPESLGPARRRRRVRCDRARTLQHPHSDEGRPGGRAVRDVRLARPLEDGRSRLRLLAPGRNAGGRTGARYETAGRAGRRVRLDRGAAPARWRSGAQNRIWRRGGPGLSRERGSVPDDGGISIKHRFGLRMPLSVRRLLDFTGRKAVAPARPAP